MRRFHRLAGAERLGGNGLDAGGLQLGQGRLENVLHAAEMFNQPPRPGRTQSRGKSQGEPLYSETLTGPGAHGQSFGHSTTSASSDLRTL
jgi:hypothetical protein